MDRTRFWIPVAGLIFTVFGTLLFVGEPTAVDRMVILWTGEWRSPILDRFMAAVTKLGSPPAMLLFSLGLSGLLIVRKRVRKAALFLLSLFGAALLASLLKEVTRRARPTDALFEMGSYAFPSWHAAVSAALAAAVIVIFAHRVPSGYRTLFLSAVISWPLMIGTTRIYLHLHWFSDVLAGWGIGLLWTGLLALTPLGGGGPDASA